MYVKTLRGSLRDTLDDGEDTELEIFTGKKKKVRTCKSHPWENSM